jgi:NAD(P)-dependent dehydrogenase (short-subunit alcohol dehydrogenase family)
MSRSLFGLEGKSVLVLGGGRGMGESTARLLAAVGCNVAILDVDKGRADTVVASLTGMGVRSVAYVADVTDDNQLASAVAQADADFAGLHGLVAIVGMAGWAPLLEMDPDIWDEDHRRNLRYFFLAAKFAAAAMIRRGNAGSLVCISSIDGIRSAPYHASYGAAKAGLLNLVRTMAAEWSAHKIRANVVAPGGIITPRIPLFPEDEERAITKPVPMGHRGTTDDIGKAVLFFLSDLSAYVTGQTLAVDGGYTSVGPLDYSTTLKKVGRGGTMGVPRKS